MSTILFDRAVFGPVKSRRLGISLGINLLPENGKVCSFDCLYCECGYTRGAEPSGKLSTLPTRAEVERKLEATLKQMAARGERPDVITFAGNGEPTLNPQFANIIEDTVELRDRLAPEARVCVLTNATRLGNESVVKALCMTDEAILKIDSGLEETIMRMDRPAPGYSLRSVVEQIKKEKARLGDALTIQTMFASWTDGQGEYDNSREADVAPWLDIVREIAPPRVMIYTIDRETPLKTMAKTPREVLDKIADRAREIVDEVTVSY